MTPGANITVQSDYRPGHGSLQAKGHLCRSGYRYNGDFQEILLEIDKSIEVQFSALYCMNCLPFSKCMYTEIHG